MSFRDNPKSLSDAIMAICTLILILHFTGIFSIDILFDDDEASVLKKHQSFLKSDLTERGFLSFMSSNPTDLQKENLTKSQKNKIVQWTGKVENVEKNRKHYIVEMQNDLVPDSDAARFLVDGIRLLAGKKDNIHVDSVCGRVFIFPANDKDSEVLLRLKRGDAFRFEGMLSDINSRGCVTVKYGLLSKDQSKLSDVGYFTELISEFLNASGSKASTPTETVLKKNQKVFKQPLQCLGKSRVRYETNMGEMTIDVLSDHPWDKFVEVAIAGKKIYELDKVSKCPELWISNNNEFQYWVFSAGEGGNACEGPYKILSLGEGRSEVHTIDTCYGFEVLIDNQSITFNKNNIKYTERNLGSLR